MEERRRLFLLALIIVAVAVGAVGLAFVSLFEAGVEQQRAALRSRVAAPAEAAAGMERQVAIVRENGRWRLADPASGHAVPANLLERLVPETPARVAPGGMLEFSDPRSEYLAVARLQGEHAAVLAWTPLDELRAPYHRAALESVVGLVVLLAIGLALFYRTTAPLVRHIAASEARYRTLFSGTAEGVLLLSETIEDCNPRAVELFRCARESIVGQPWPFFFRKYGGRDECLHQFRVHVDLALTDVGKPFVCRFTRPDGSPLVAEIMLRRLDEGGRLPRILASLRDVTDREEAAEALRDAERNLRDSREKLVQSGRASALVELVAGVAHEVNQPLAAIANYAQASRRLASGHTDGNPDVVRALERIAEQAQRAGDAIHRIQALVSGTPDTRRGIACINRLVREVVALMAEDIEVVGADVSLDLADDVPPVRADALQIQQVIMQLLRNALDSVATTPAGGRSVRISSHCRNGCVEVTVTDAGRGIAREDAQRLFEPFFSTKENGMGMGLPISMSIIRAHAGELEFDPAYRQGACFRFRLAAVVSTASTEGSDAECRDRVAP